MDSLSIIFPARGAVGGDGFLGWSPTVALLETPDPRVAQGSSAL